MVHGIMEVSSFPWLPQIGHSIPALTIKKPPDKLSTTTSYFDIYLSEVPFLFTFRWNVGTLPTFHQKEQKVFMMKDIHYTVNSGKGYV
jgi:hypothetical protein